MLYKLINLTKIPNIINSTTTASIGRVYTSLQQFYPRSDTIHIHFEQKDSDIILTLIFYYNSINKDWTGIKIICMAIMVTCEFWKLQTNALFSILNCLLPDIMATNITKYDHRQNTVNTWNMFIPIECVNHTKFT